MELRFTKSVDEVPRDAWNALVHEDDPPFVEWEWLDALEKSRCLGGKSGWVPCHFVMYDGDEVVAAAPAYIKTNSEGEFVFDWSWAEVSEKLDAAYYPKLVLAVPFTPVTGSRVLCKDRALRSKWIPLFAEAALHLAKIGELSSIHVLFPNADEAAEWARCGFLARLGMQYHFENRGYADFEDFLQTLPSKKRTQLRRERAQLARDRVTIDHLPEASLALHAAEMHALYLTTVDKFMWGRRYLNPEFFRTIASTFAHRLDWVVARRDGHVVASAFNARKGSRLYGRYWGTKVELPFLHFNVCYYEGIVECIRRGLSVFEPGAGGEHKRARGFVPTLTHSMHHLMNPRLASLVEDFLARERRAIVDYVVAEGGRAPHI
jgi:predicted N-acyltransferase